MQWVELRERLLAAILGTGFVAVGVLGLPMMLLLAAIASQPPDSNAMDGDPCCPVPDSWLDVVAWSGGSLFATGIDGALLAGGFACSVFSATYRWPSRWLLAAPLLLVATVLALMVALVALQAAI